MKYFIRLHNAAQAPLHDLTLGITHEMTEKKALFYYRLLNKGIKKGGENLAAQPEFRKGIFKRSGSYEFWGENISNRELFKLRLNGEVAKKVIGK